MARQRFRLRAGDHEACVYRVLTRRALLLSLLGTSVSLAAGAEQESTEGFRARLLTLPGMELDPERRAGAGRWAAELERRTSAETILSEAPEIKLGSRALLDDPFLFWAGAQAVAEIAEREISLLRNYLTLGGMLIVDDTDPDRHVFVDSAKREILRALPGAHPIALDRSHVLFKTFYLLDRPVGRVLGPPTVEGIVRGGIAQVLFLRHDLLGALARSTASMWAHDVFPGGALQREQAVRLAVNLAMYVLCLDYKDDQVHAAWLMRRHSRSHP